MNRSQRNLRRLQPLLDHLSQAVAADDAAEFERVLDDLLHARRRELFNELRKLTAQVRSALQDFQLGARCAELAEKDVPDARQRLLHVLKLTDAAAHRTMDLIENSGTRLDLIVAALPRHLDNEPAERSVAAAVAQTAASELRRNLSDMLLAQGYQDLTGQIVRSVITLVDEVEAALSGLARVIGDVAGEAPGPAAGPGLGVYGPAVPGVDGGASLGSQQDVDALLSSLAL